MARAKTVPEPEQQPSFEELLRRIEQIIAQLEGGKLPLGDSLACYEEAVQHLRTCFGILEQAEQRVALVTGVAPDGTPVSQPFDETMMTLEQKSDQRSHRRSVRKEPPSGQKTLLDDD